MTLFERTSRVIRAEINSNRSVKSHTDSIQALRETGIELKRSIDKASSSQQKLQSELQKIIEQSEALIREARYQKYHGNIEAARAYLVRKNEILKPSVGLRKQIEQYEQALTALRDSLAKIEKHVGEIPDLQTSNDEF